MNKSQSDSSVDVSQINEHKEKTPVKFKIEANDCIQSLLTLYNSINEKKKALLIEFKTTKDLSVLYLIQMKLSMLDELLKRVFNGLHSAKLMIEFMQMSNVMLKHQIMLSKEEEFLRENLLNLGNKFIRASNAYTKINNHLVIREAEMDHLAFSLYFHDPYYFDNGKILDTVWNVAIFENSDESFIHLPEELIHVKWICNLEGDRVIEFGEFLGDYCEQNGTDRKLPMRLCYMAKRFYECRNYRCAAFIQQFALDVLRKNRTDTKERYHQFRICKALIQNRLGDPKASQFIVESIQFLEDKFSQDNQEHQLIILQQFVNVSCVLAGWDYVESALELFSTTVEKLDTLLPHSYDLWIQSLTLMTRFYNDSGLFRSGLIVAAQGFDFFYIQNFGKVLPANRPIYEVAIEISKRGRVVKASRQLKYPSYLPSSIIGLLKEMMISLSGMGDRSSVNVIQNWINRCDLLSSNIRKTVIEQYEYSPDLGKVISRMRKNRLRHPKIFGEEYESGSDLSGSDSKDA